MRGKCISRLVKIDARMNDMTVAAYTTYINLLSGDEITSELEAMAAGIAAKKPGQAANGSQPDTFIVRPDLWRKVIADMLNGGG